MPDMLKIGYSKHGGRVRAKQIYSQGGTGVPMPYKMEFETWVGDCKEVEMLVHEELQNYRVNNDREFFNCPLSEAVQSLLSVVASDYDLMVEHVDYAVRSCELPASYKASIMYKEKTGRECYPPDIANALDYLTTEAICDALIKNSEVLEKRKKAREARSNKFNGEANNG